MSQSHDQSFTAEDLDQLEHLLATVAPEDAMSVDEIHGFLTALVCTPELLLPSEWLHFVWGGDEPEFATTEQANEVIDLIMRFANHVVERLVEDDLDPLFLALEFPDGKVRLYPFGWCIGFLEGTRLLPECWQGDELGEMLWPIEELADAIGDHSDIDAWPDDEALIEERAEQVVLAVSSIYRHQRTPVRPPHSVRRTGPKVGRNAPCPCGSGKKYKKCCGAEAGDH